jgi:hypothetical protein
VGKIHRLHWQPTRKPHYPQASQLSIRTAAQFDLQCPGAHIGGGAPPSAKEEIETALRSTKVASIRRTIFFMRNPLRGLATHSEATIFFLRQEIRSVRKARDEKSSFVGVPTERIEGQTGSNLGIHRFSSLITPVARATTGIPGVKSSFAEVPKFVGKPTKTACSRPKTPRKVS